MKTFKEFCEMQQHPLYTNKIKVKDHWGDVYIHHSHDSDGRMSCHVNTGGRNIARATLDRTNSFVQDVSVEPEFRRKGIASKMYEYIEKHIGKKLVPSPLHQTDNGKALWKNR